MSDLPTPLLQVEGLSVEFQTNRGALRAIEDVSFDVRPGEIVCLVGESGCGKSITSLALMGLLPPNGRVASGRILYQGRDVAHAAESERQALRGGEIGMIFQDPMTSLNPAFTVGFQLMESLRAHAGGSKSELKARAIALLRQVGIPAPEARMDSYPHQLSGGMSQRVMIAIAIACKPKMLIADEPTTALDVTIQAQILDLLLKLRDEEGMSLILITHDVGVVAEMADRVVVMYAGHVVEQGLVREVIEDPKHPYTRGLLDSLPGSAIATGQRKARLPSIAGLVPDLRSRPEGCLFNPRCARADAKCRDSRPGLMHIASPERAVRCFYPVGGA